MAYSQYLKMHTVHSQVRLQILVSKMFISMKDKSGVDRDRSANHLFCEQAEPSGRLGFGDLNSDMTEKGVQPPGCTLLYGSQEACEKILH